MKNLLNSGKKIITIFILVNSTIWVYLSYLLAFLGREDIAESLSGKVVTEVIAVILAYCISSTVENVFRYNEVGGKSVDVDC